MVDGGWFYICLVPFVFLHMPSFVDMVGYGVGVASVAVLHTCLCSTLGPHSQTEGVKWEHVCADQCAGCRW